MSLSFSFISGTDNYRHQILLYAEMLGEMVNEEKDKCSGILWFNGDGSNPRICHAICSSRPGKPGSHRDNLALKSK